MNKLKGIILVVSICFASIMMPFNIYADSATIVGTDVSLISTNLLSEENWTVSDGTKRGYYNQFIYHVTVQLDNNYVGYLVLRLQGSYYNDIQSGLTTNNFDVSRRVFVNGDKAEFNFNITTYYNTDPLLRNTTNGHPNASIVSQGVTLLSELDSIQQIIDILQDLYNSNDQIEGLLSDQLSQLELIVSNTSLANQYLDTISKMRQYNFPIESLGFVSYSLNRNKNYVIDAFNFSYYKYPVFQIPSNTNIFNISTYTNIDSYLILICRYINTSNISNFINIENGTISKIEQLSNITYSTYNSTYQCYKITFRANSSSDNVYFKSIINNFVYIPISFSINGRSTYSTDFSLLYGFTNPLIDNINKIANGTAASNNASQQLDSDTSDFVSDRDDLVNIEDNMGDNMDSAMNQITPNNNGLSGFGGNFLTSAVWVRTQFERLTNNTPYGSLIVYGMTLGLALLLLGKVML